MRDSNFQRLQPDANPPGGDNVNWPCLSWFWPVFRYSGGALLWLVLLLGIMPDMAFSASGGQPFVIHETFEGHAEPAASQVGHGVVGLDLLIQRGHYPLVQGVFRGTPAASQGLLPGDMILAVNGVSTLGKSINQVDSMISDVPGDRLMLTVQRGVQLSRVRLTVAALEALPSGLRSDFSYLFGNTP